MNVMLTNIHRGSAYSVVVSIKDTVPSQIARISCSGVQGEIVENVKDHV